MWIQKRLLIGICKIRNSGNYSFSLNYVQLKLVSVLKGKIFDVAVDFRIGNSTFGNHKCY
ncbi:MAG: dTDP-4-dehydrorhamnose 3,5-epimerase family protein [Aliarcobacter sp.]|nr:dTDP-4-dehydrorhamnose 3,5-epimerase family protein [Aliarcobacter sp.]MDD4330677.1 dTDP-4-dehydrorhamnose 3,5-epimerase family protein [Aliarcobacter sp.]